MIALDEALPFADAARIIPGRPSRMTLHRWTHRGLRGVRLETLLIANRRYTSRQAIERFIAATNGDRAGDAA